MFFLQTLHYVMHLNPSFDLQPVCQHEFFYCSLLVGLGVHCEQGKGNVSFSRLFGLVYHCDYEKVTSVSVLKSSASSAG